MENLLNRLLKLCESLFAKQCMLFTIAVSLDIGVPPAIFLALADLVGWWGIITASIIHGKSFCLFDLMIYVHGKQLRSCWEGQYLTTLFQGKPPGGSLPVLSAHSFTSN